MKVYRISIRDKFEEHNGYSYFSSLAEAKKQNKKQNEGNSREDEIEEIEFEPSKKGIISLLNSKASYPDNG